MVVVAGREENEAASRVVGGGAGLASEMCRGHTLVRVYIGSQKYWNRRVFQLPVCFVT